MRIFGSKGASTNGKPLVSRPTKTNKGKIPLHLIGTDTAKRTLFARLKLVDKNALGYIHFHKDLDDEFFLQLTAEKLVLMKNKLGFKYYAYKKIRERNEAIDLIVLNMASLELLRPNWVKIAEGFVKIEKKSGDDDDGEEGEEENDRNYEVRKRIPMQNKRKRKGSFVKRLGEIWSHQSRIRCGICLDVDVVAIGTVQKGRKKRWQCNKCKHKFNTFGLKI